MGVAEETVPGQRAVTFGTVVVGLVIGAVEVVFAVSFAALVFAGYLEFYFLDDGVGLYLGAAALTLAFMAWRAGRRGVVGGLQGTGAAMMAVVSASVVVHGAGSPNDIFLSALAATLVAMILCGVVFWWLGSRRRGDLIRFVPYPVVGGFLAGTGWLLFKGGVYVASLVSPFFNPLSDLLAGPALQRWLPALAFGVILLIAVRVIKRPLVIPAVIAIGLVVFVVGVVVTGSSMDEVRGGKWLLGSFDSGILWKSWTLSALGGAGWLSVLESWAGIATAVFVATFAILFNISGTELVLDRDLDTNQELRDAGILNVVSGALGGIPGYHALSFTAFAERMRVDARAAGLIAALVPLAAVVFGAQVVGMIPRMIVGGVLVFLGLGFMVDWVWDKRRLLPPLEYAVVLLILVAIIAWGFLIGVVVGLVLAVVLFAVSYGRIELVHEVAFGDTYRSTVDRPATERAELRELSDRVQILRVSGFVFFGSTNRLLERIRRRTGSTPPRFLVIDLRRVTGVDSSAVVSFVKMMRLAEAAGSEIVFTSASDPVRAQLARGGVVETEGLVAFEPDLDRGCSGARTRCSPPPAWPRLGGSIPPRAVPTLCHRDSPPTSSASRCPRARSCSTRMIRRATSTCSSPDASAWRPSRPRARGSGSGRSARGSSWVRSRSTPASRGPPTWWPRRRAWSCASAVSRSNGSRPMSRSSPRRCTGGSPRCWRSD